MSGLLKSSRLLGVGLSLVLGLVALLAVPGAALAAEATATQTRVSVWPEYDDPRVLVILQADLSEDTALPTTVSFNIPKDAEIGMACEVDGSGGHSCKPYQLEDKGDYQTLSYTVDSQRKVFLEYYYEAFPAAAGARDFTVDFRPAFPAGAVTLEVQQPARATEFTLNPEFPDQATDSQGLTAFTKQVPEVAVGEAYPIEISYSKADAEPSVQPQDNPPAADVPMSQSSTNNSILVVAAAIGFGLLLFLGYRSFRPSMGGASGRRSRSGGSGRGREAAPAKKAGGRGSSTPKRAAGRFCTQCGESLSSNDRFCSGCGTEVEN